MESEREIIRLKLQKLKLLEQMEEQRRLLPHRFLYKHYKWSQEFYDDLDTRIQIICSGNQASKSSTQMRKVIELATNPELWQRAWPRQAEQLGAKFVPNLFLYFYPDLKLATVEFEFKWKQFLPNFGEDHPQYGWRAVYDARKLISEIRFNSGVTILFKGYSQDVISLQAVTPYLVAIDEEPPWDIMGEIMARLNSSNGMFSAAFTATIGQTEWEQIVEKRTMWTEARVWQISLYDCLKYADGSNSHWTVDQIKLIEKRCGTEKEVLKRVYGRFVKSDGLAVPEYGSHNRGDQLLKEMKPDWPRFAGIDYGSGGETGHPSSIALIAVRPDFSEGVCYKLWRGDGILTAAQDVVDKYLELRGHDQVWMSRYDWAARDLATIAERAGLTFEKANKAREYGFGTLNSLFKNRMLWIPTDKGDDHGQFDKLSTELNTLSQNADKKKAKDDAIDALRYGISSIPWNFTFEHEPKAIEEKKKEYDERAARRAGFDYGENDVSRETFESEIQEWDSLLNPEY